MLLEQDVKSISRAEWSTLCCEALKIDEILPVGIVGGSGVCELDRKRRLPDPAHTVYRQDCQC
ncbi:MAG: hypothetical protein AUG49_25050 [Catenulispora sp. 13_1_20CM_3_70_7]|nr:MAG: hypothetical protein AUG49_25050 [Catenulispora sp. 13_1_20CM_3_70_7]